MITDEEALKKMHYFYDESIIELGIPEYLLKEFKGYPLIQKNVITILMMKLLKTTGNKEKVVIGIHNIFVNDLDDEKSTEVTNFYLDSSCLFMYKLSLFIMKKNGAGTFKFTYNNHTASAEYNSEDDTFYGELTIEDDLLNFQGSADNLLDIFKKLVDEHLSIEDNTTTQEPWKMEWGKRNQSI